MKAALYLIAITNAILAAASPTGADVGVASVTPNNPFLADTFEHASMFHKTSTISHHLFGP
jgi:hypothetical protein